MDVEGSDFLILFLFLIFLLRENLIHKDERKTSV